MIAYILITILLIIVIAQTAYIVALQRSPLGVLSPAALRLQMALLSLVGARRFVVALDIRKMHELNAVLDYSGTNRIVGHLLAVTRHQSDVVGQYGGDEFAIIGRGGKVAAERVIRRLLERRDEINAAMDAGTRARLSAATGGLVDGLHLAIAWAGDTDNVGRQVAALIDETEALKMRGVTMTGDRARDGKAGTLIAEL